jgi:hypothetical protein
MKQFGDGLVVTAQRGTEASSGQLDVRRRHLTQCLTPLRVP